MCKAILVPPKQPVVSILVRSGDALLGHPECHHAMPDFDIFNFTDRHKLQKAI